MTAKVINNGKIIEVEKGAFLYIDKDNNFYNYWEIEIL